MTLLTRYLLGSFFIHWASLVDGFNNLAVIPFASPSCLFATIPSSTYRLDEGAKKFEIWFDKATKDNNSLSKVRHCTFSDGIRGLEYLGSSSDRNEVIITLPKNRVLYSTSVEAGTRPISGSSDSTLRWDVSLALKLLDEYKKGTDSEYYGYCQLLTQGCDFQEGSCPPSTAPNALRNWTREQIDLFKSECGSRGKELLRIQENQKKEWMDQFHQLSTSLQGMYTFEQFAWAMEAVYSRSFKGDAISNLSTQLIYTIIVPLAAMALGVNYLISNPNQSNDALTMGLGLISFLPLVLKNIAPKSTNSEAVLLPFIDSANHMEQADSQILYDPLKGIFTLTVSGENAFVDDEDCDGRKCTQLYISYGAKRDTELLLNYGFLPGVYSSEKLMQVTDCSQRLDHERKALIQAFRKRNL